MSIKPVSPLLFSFLLLLNLAAVPLISQPVQARKHTQSASKKSSGGRSRESAAAGTSSHKHAVAHLLRGVRHTALAATGHRGRHHGKQVTAHIAPKTRYAYSASLFMPKPPDFEQTPLAPALAEQVERAFEQGTADSYPTRTLVRAGIIHYHPLHGGIFWRREPVKYIVMHSTEPGIDQSAPRIIDSWNSMGIRHPGAQYVVGRDGSIYQAVDPELATVHVNIFKTLPGINNDNSIGIEMCHYGHQDYPKPQRESVTKLVTYLQERYKVPDENVITHRYAQQGDHTDPVYFDWDGFVSDKSRLRTRAIAMRVNKINEEARQMPEFDPSASMPAPATTFLLEPHLQIKSTSTTATVKNESGKKVTETKTVTTTTTVPLPAGSADALRGPIEVDPGMVRQLSTPMLPAIKSKSVTREPKVETITAPASESSEPMSGTKTSAPEPGNESAGTESMDPDGKGADAKPTAKPDTNQPLMQGPDGEPK